MDNVVEFTYQIVTAPKPLIYKRKVLENSKN